MTIEALVDNIGKISEHATVQEAIEAIHETICNSERAHNHGVVLRDGEIVAEVGQLDEE